MTMKVTRRSLIRALPFFGAAVAAPAIAAQPSGAVIPVEVVELIADWNRKCDRRTTLWADLEAATAHIRTAKRWEHPLYTEWQEASLDAESAMGAMLRALRESDLPIERRAFA